jgi:plasmid stabilization system protein ParE
MPRFELRYRPAALADLEEIFRRAALDHVSRSTHSRPMYSRQRRCKPDRRL